MQIEIFLDGLVHFIFHDDILGEDEQKNLSEHLREKYTIIDIDENFRGLGNGNICKYRVAGLEKSTSYIDMVEFFENTLFGSKSVIISAYIKANHNLDDLKVISKLIDTCQRIQKILKPGHGDIKLMFLVGGGARWLQPPPNAL
jgi:hypothetical protein